MPAPRMPNLALPSTSEFPGDPTELEREELEAVYLQLRGHYRSLMISRGLHRSRSAQLKEQIGQERLEQVDERKRWKEDYNDLDDRLNAALKRESRLKLQAYSLLAGVTEVMEQLEDAGDELSTAFGAFQLGKRRPGGGRSSGVAGGGYGGGGLAGGGAGMAQLMKGVLHFLNRWRLGKQRFRTLMNEREQLLASLQTQPGQLESEGRPLPWGDAEAKAPDSPDRQSAIDARR